MALRLAGEEYAEGGVSDHGQLDGLGDDDHAQYLLADGTRNAAKVIVTDGASHYLQVPKLTTAERDALAAVNGMLIYNTTTGQFERYQAGAWGAFAGGGGGDMYKSVYDTDDDGVVDNAEKLEGSTKAQVQSHSIAGLSGEAADLQKVKDHTHQSAGGGVGGKLDHGLALDGLGDDDHVQYVLRNILTTHGDLFFRGASAIERLGPGTSGQFLKTQGSGAAPVWSGLDFFDKFRDIVPWLALDGFITTIDSGGGIQAAGHNLYLYTHSDAGDRAYLYANCGLYKLIGTGKKTTVEWVIFTFTITVANSVVYLHMTESLTAPPSETYRHFGFKILNGDIYASNADGTTQKITDTGVDLSTGAQLTPLKVVVNQGVDVKFYVNGVLKVTHTENLPPVPDIDYRLNMGLTTNEAAAKYMRLGRVAYEREW